MNKNEFSKTKTIVSPDGKTIITMTVNGNSISSTNTTSTTVLTTTTTLTSSTKKEHTDDISE